MTLAASKDLFGVYNGDDSGKVQMQHLLRFILTTLDKPSCISYLELCFLWARCGQSWRSNCCSPVLGWSVPTGGRTADAAQAHLRLVIGRADCWWMGEVA